jgi:hypothetical protein
MEGGVALLTSAPPNPHHPAARFIDLTGDVITWRRAQDKAAVTVRASLTDLLLAIYLRKPVHSNELLDLWPGHVGFA